AFGEDVREGASAVVLRAELRQLVRISAGAVGDLLLAEKFEVSVVVEREDAGQTPGRADGLQQPGFRARSISNRPRDFLADDTIVLPARVGADTVRLAASCRECQKAAEVSAHFPRAARGGEE